MTEAYELLGYPCSGKSTFIKRTSHNNIYLAKKKSLLLRCLLFLLPFMWFRAFFAGFLTLFLIPKAAFFPQILAIIRFYSRIIERRLLASNKFMDEGIYQSLWGLFYSTKPTEFRFLVLDFLLRYFISSIKLVYFIDIPLDELMKRNIERVEQTRFSRDLIKNNSFDNETINLMDYIVCFLARHSKIVS